MLESAIHFDPSVCKYKGNGKKSDILETHIQMPLLGGFSAAFGHCSATVTRQNVKSQATVYLNVQQKSKG